MKILAIGDVVSSVGCEYLRKVLPDLKKELQADIVIVNGENSATGNGILPQSADWILDSGADVVTGGNHSLRRFEIYDYLDSNKPVIRPANFHKTAPGNGYWVVDKGAYQVGVINLQGLVYLDPLSSPFDTADKIVEQLNEQGCKIIIIDFHAEATAEKRALGFYLDGKVSAVFGTHTHVQTSDNQVLPLGTGYITDLGMTGPYFSVLGIKPELAIKKIKTNLPVRFENEDGASVLEGCLFEIDIKSGKCLSVTTVRR